jgi:radical SAM protein with 4Fe4S-binding SPASM domain
MGIYTAPHQLILERVWRHLFDQSELTGPKFDLSASVIEEIDSLCDDQVPRYLINRFRYEIFPQTQELDEYPPYLQIEPTSICNYRCVFCFETDPFFTKKSNGFMGHMTLETFKKIVDQALGHVEFISIASRGEPLLCPHIESMLAYTVGKFLNLKLNTNASLLDEKKAHAILQSGVKTLVISADAAEEPLYSQLRVNGSLTKVLDNVDRFQRIRANHYPDSNIITRVSGVSFSDRQDFDSMQRLWGGMVDQVAFVEYNPWENVYDRTPGSIIAPCSDLWRRMFVWWDGKANPCDVDYRSSLSVGNIFEHTLAELWHSSKYQSLREDHLNSRRTSRAPCNRCSVV